MERPISKRCAKKNHLFLTSPQHFNDPFDCRIPKNYLSLNTLEKVTEFVERYIFRHADSLIKNGKSVEAVRKYLHFELTNNLSEFQVRKENFLYGQQDMYYGILSMTTQWDNILMWSHYGDYHKGVCYGFWEEKLRESLNFAEGGPVNYPSSNEYPNINPLDENIMKHGFIETHTKAHFWKYESEYRLFSLLFPNTDDDPKIPTDDDRTRKIPDDFFAEIILGISMQDSHRSEIVQIARQKNIKIFQAIKVPFKFEIAREEIID
ncbi:MAG: DUF2971 domain-containing protein [Bacteroidetes bacterium]|nr:DUF2971 domain-containing protein [Bacteroidota bacterium]